MKYLKLINPMLTKIVDALSEEAQKSAGETADKWIRIGAEAVKAGLEQAGKEFNL